jgi:restriction endonuclease S subunit
MLGKRQGKSTSLISNVKGASVARPGSLTPGTMIPAKDSRVTAPARGINAKGSANDDRAFRKKMLSLAGDLRVQFHKSQKLDLSITAFLERWGNPKSYTSAISPWPMLSIEEVCTCVRVGGTPSRSHPEYFFNGTIPWVKSQELNDTWIHDTEEKITTAAVARSSVKPLPPNTILMGMYGSTLGRLGILGRSMACNQACCAMTVNPKKADFRYLFYLLRSSRNQIKSLATGRTQKNISAATIKSLPFPFPPLNVQKDIVEIFMDLDEVIKLKQELKTTLGGMVRGVPCRM